MADFNISPANHPRRVLLSIWAAPIVLAASLYLAAAAPARVPDTGARYSGWDVESFAVAEKILPSAEERLPGKLLDEIQQGLALNGKGGIFGRRRPAYDPQLLQDDTRRIRLYLARSGFPESMVEPFLEPNLVERSLKIVLEVDPGPRVRVEDIVVSGFPVHLAFSADSLLEVERNNARYSDHRVQETSEAIADLLQESGYAKVTVESHSRRQSSGNVILTYHVQPGDRYHITAVRVEGVAPDLVPLVENNLRKVVGEIYSPRSLDRVRGDLRRLEILRQVQLQTEPIAEGELELRARLSARAYRVTSVSVGTWSDHYARVKASWRHRNLFHGGRGFSIGGAWSPNQWEAETAAWWPSMPHTKALSRIRLAQEAEREAAYREDRTNLGIAVILKPDWRNQWLFEAAVSHVEVENRSSSQDAFERGAGELLTLAIARQGDYTNDLLDPTRGFRFRLRGEGSPSGFVSDYPFVSGEAEVSAYVGLVGRIVMAARLGISVAEPIGKADRLLPDKRFYAGGNSSMRGYGRRALGPKDTEDNPLGGQARFLAGVELRMHFNSWLGMPLFLDGGQLWGERRNLNPRALEWALGSGVIVYTPVGPIRLDGAYNLTGASDERDSWAVHVSIGHAY